jgi:hypothetical protein
MALSRIEREILTRARKHIAEGMHFRICYAINDASCHFMRGPDSHVEAVKGARDRLRTFIIDSIGNRFGFENWVCDQNNEHSHLWRDCDAMKKARLAWIDWLLDEPWTEHKGGPQPVMSNERVHVRCRDGYESTRPADTFRWNHVDPQHPGQWSPLANERDIVAYKVMYEAPTPVAAPNPLHDETYCLAA